MKTRIPEVLTSMDDVRAYLKELHDNDEAYHPEDDARELDFGPEDGARLNAAMRRVYEICDAHGEDPCEILLTLGGHVYED